MGPNEEAKPNGSVSRPSRAKTAENGAFLYHAVRTTNNENEAANEKFSRADRNVKMGLRASNAPAKATARPLAPPNSQKHQKRFCLWCLSTQRFFAGATDPTKRTACRSLRE